ncbi:maleylpyruvate isomerase N-terminal domain-containing protein [Actinophytocola glycyrrhizae]|uniref:Maleylpyruvate isomerase N-terminal domain-containing protein n=1 Tax=Actinophytocola glycyrrhizae TaxID=2044873 RepID=A0ABV9SFD0_9PSEU
MEFGDYLERTRQQATALRAAAVAAGPEAEVPTCPGWTVHRLVRHIARVQAQVVLALDADAAGEAPRTERPPEDWDELLAFWDGQVDTMLTELARRGSGAPAWAFAGFSGTAFWARRQAHETAIHRLDAEHAAHGDDVPHLVFDSEFAADGADEVLTIMVARFPAQVTGTVLVHAADAGRAWLVTLTTGAPPVVGKATDIDTDASLVGTADAVYRALWKRPSTALVNGDPALVAALRTP